MQFLKKWTDILKKYCIFCVFGCHFLKNCMKWLVYMYIKGFRVKFASYRNFGSNMVGGQCAVALLGIFSPTHSMLGQRRRQTPDNCHHTLLAPSPSSCTVQSSSRGRKQSQTGRRRYLSGKLLKNCKTAPTGQRKAWSVLESDFWGLFSEIWYVNFIYGK